MEKKNAQWEYQMIVITFLILSFSNKYVIKCIRVDNVLSISGFCMGGGIDELEHLGWYGKFYKVVYLLHIRLCSLFIEP